MPLGETLTLLATLANAVQVLRASRTAVPPAHEPEATLDLTARMGLDLAKTANEEALRRHESASNRLAGLVVVSAAAMLLSAFLGAVSSDSPEGGSPLFIASLGFFVVVLAGVIVLRRAFSISRLSLEDFESTQGTIQREERTGFIDRARAAEHTNNRRLTALDLGTDALIVLLAVQVILAAAWLIS